jgi:hypothetical protein
MVTSSRLVEQKVELSGISWQTYETLLRELSARRLRLTYNRGNLEIIVPSPEHEVYQLQNRQYVSSNESLAFPIPITEISSFLQQAMTVDCLALVSSFRQWVKSQNQQNL